MATLGETLFALPVWYQLLLAVVLGAIWGSFVSALSTRWPQGKRVSEGRSHCDHCQTKLSTKDLIPILSYVFLRGKCRYCAQPIGVAALYIELASAGIGLAAMVSLSGLHAVSAAIFGWLLLPLAVLDGQKLWLPNRLVVILALVGVLFGPLVTPEVSWLDRFLGGIGGFLALEMIRQAFRIARNQDGMGGGDPKLFGAIGIWLGWQALPMTLLLSCTVGFGFIVVAYARSKNRAYQLPFGSFLCVAAYIMAVIKSAF